MKITAQLFDGKSSKEYLVTIEFTADRRVKIESHGIDVPLEKVEISTPLGNTPRLLKFPNGIRCKSDENDAIDAILQKFDIKESLIHKLERSWKSALASIAIIAAVTLFMLTIGADSTARFLAKKLPEHTLDKASKNTLHMLDKSYLHKSNLSAAKKEKIRLLFQKLAGNDKRYHLYFRSSPRMGPNAFALPNGDIVIIDSIVYLDKDPNLYGLLGVLAHEKGHVVYKHGLQGLIKGAIVGAVVGYISGDLSYITTALPTMILTSKYSRQFESQADAYAKSELHKMGISTKPLAKLFMNLEKYTHKKEKGKENEDNFQWLSEHPVTSKRIDFFMKD